MALRFPAKVSLVPVLASAVLCFGATVTAVGSSGGRHRRFRTSNPAGRRPWRSTCRPRFGRWRPRDASTNRWLRSSKKSGRSESVRAVRDRGHSPDGALQGPAGSTLAPSLAIPRHRPLTFEGVSNQDNFNIFGFRVNPPDPVGDVGPNHYVEMINLVYAVYNKSGEPAARSGRHRHAVGGLPDRGLHGSLGRPDRRLRPARGPLAPEPVHDARPRRSDAALLQLRRHLGRPAIRPARTTATPSSHSRIRVARRNFFPDYPKYGVWKKSYVLTTRDFGFVNGYGISVYALEKNKMIAGNPNARAVQFFLDSDVVPLNLIGDGLLPADIDGTKQPKEDAAIPIVGTQDDGAGYGATFDAVNIWDLEDPLAGQPGRLARASRLNCPVAPVRLDLPVRADIPRLPAAARHRRPGSVPRHPFLPPAADLAARVSQFQGLRVDGDQPVRRGDAGRRRRALVRDPAGRTAPTRSTSRAPTRPATACTAGWARIAQDKNGNMALGYSVVNGTTVFPGIRYTGRLAGDPLGTMTLGEGTVIDGTGVQTDDQLPLGRLHVDEHRPVRRLHVLVRQRVLHARPARRPRPAGWQTRIASFKLPGCIALIFWNRKAGAVTRRPFSFSARGLSAAGGLPFRVAIPMPLSRRLSFRLRIRDDDREDFRCSGASRAGPVRHDPLQPDSVHAFRLRLDIGLRESFSRSSRLWPCSTV